MASEGNDSTRGPRRPRDFSAKGAFTFSQVKAWGYPSASKLSTAAQQKEFKKTAVLQM